MKTRTVALAAAAVSLVAAPAIAQADMSRALAPIEGESKLAGTALALAILSATAVVAGVAMPAGGGEDDSVSG